MSELETDPLLGLTFEGAVPRPLFQVGGDARPHGNDATVSRNWDFPPGAALSASTVLAQVRAAGQTFERVTCFTSATIAMGLREISADAGAVVYVVVEEPKRTVQVELVGQPALTNPTVPVTDFTGCADEVVSAAS